MRNEARSTPVLNSKHLLVVLSTEEAINSTLKNQSLDVSRQTAKMDNFGFNLCTLMLRGTCFKKPIWKRTVLYSLHALNNTFQIWHKAISHGDTKRNNNHSFIESSRRPVENLTQGLIRMYCNALAQNCTGSLDAKFVRACPGTSCPL